MRLARGRAARVRGIFGDHRVIFYGIFFFFGWMLLPLL